MQENNHSNNNSLNNNLLTRKQVANMLGIKETTLAVWACTKRYKLPYIKVGKSVRYKLAYIEAFLQSRKQER